MTIPPECCPRWRGRSWISSKSRAKSRICRSAGIEPGARQTGLQIVVGVDPLVASHVLGEAVDLLDIHPEDLADLTRSALLPISDDVGRHRSAARTVALVDVLDGSLAAIAARQVEVDVRPLAALLGEEALEEQLHADRIDGGDAEAVADGAVRRRAAPLHEDPLTTAEVHDVPHDQEVAGQLELADELKLVLDLSPGPLVVGAIVTASARIGHLAEVALHRLAGWHRVVGEAVAEIVEGEAQPLRQCLAAP